MSAYQSLKEEAYEANMQIPAQRLALYTWGNVSAFDKDKGVFAIKPSGVPYEKLAPDSMVVLDLEGNLVEGNLNPSSDTPTHIVLYKKFAVEGGAKIGGIIHTHSTAAVSWAAFWNDPRRPHPDRRSLHALPFQRNGRARLRKGNRQRNCRALCRSKA